jgi:uncharacterized membrane protein
VLLGDGGGQLAFAVVAVAEANGLPVVDHNDRRRVGRDLVRVVGEPTQLGEVGDEPPQPAVGPDRAEGDRVPLRV